MPLGKDGVTSHFNIRQCPGVQAMMDSAVTVNMTVQKASDGGGVVVMVVMVVTGTKAKCQTIYILLNIPNLINILNQ